MYRSDDKTHTVKPHSESKSFSQAEDQPQTELITRSNLEGAENIRE